MIEFAVAFAIVGGVASLLWWLTRHRRRERGLDGVEAGGDDLWDHIGDGGGGVV